MVQRSVDRLKKIRFKKAKKPFSNIKKLHCIGCLESTFILNPILDDNTPTFLILERKVSIK